MHHFLTRSATSGPAYLAGPLDPVINFIKPWSTGLLILGAIILGMAGAWVGMSMGARSAAAKKGDNTHVRDGIGRAVGVAIGAGIMGAALIGVALAVKIGQGAGTVG